MSRAVGSAVLAFAMAVSVDAQAVEVTLQLDQVTARACRYDPRGSGSIGRGVSCDGWLPVAVLPAAPRGIASAVDVDALGQPIRAVLNLEGYALDGTAVAPWSGVLERRDSSTFAVTDPNHPWPVSLPGQSAPGAWSVGLTRFTNQADFAGGLTLGFNGPRSPTSTWTAWRLSFSFASIPNPGAPLCAGETLLLDDDADGETNSRDLSPSGLDPNFGTGVDENGRTIADFCRAGDSGPCGRLDFRNDEPLFRKSSDCRVTMDGRTRLCAPAAIFEDAPAVVSAHVCAGHAVITDSDGDGEPDSTDRCASTPTGTLVDGNGCTAQEFCSQQTGLACRRADFQNDEPAVKNPHDCARTPSEPQVCGAETSN